MIRNSLSSPLHTCIISVISADVDRELKGGPFIDLASGMARSESEISWKTLQNAENDKEICHQANKRKPTTARLKRRMKIHEDHLADKEHGTGLLFNHPTNSMNPSSMQL